MRSASSAAARPRRAAARRAKRRAVVEQIAVDALQRIEGLERVLEDRLDGGHEGHPRALPPRHAVDVRRRESGSRPESAATRLRIIRESVVLPLPELADDGEDLRPAGRDREADVVDRAKGGARRTARPSRIGLGDVLDGEEVGGSCGRRRRFVVDAGFTARARGEAGDAMAGRERRQRRPLAAADVHGQRAARMEAAARRRRGKVGRRAAEAPSSAPTSPIRGRLWIRCGGVGVQRAREELRASAPPRPGGRHT